MNEPSTLHQELSSLIGEQVIIDVRGPYIYIGALQEIGEHVFVLNEADVHSCDDSQTTTELYLLVAKKDGVRPNRSTVYVMRSEVLSVSRLADIMVY